MTNILIVEDSKSARESIERQLQDIEGFNVLTSIENAANAEILCMKADIDLILMDVCTADGESGLKAAERIKKLYPNIKIIIMTSMPEHSFIEKARSCGCESFWYKDSDGLTLTELCCRTVNGETIYPDGTPKIRIGIAESTDFTEREMAVIRKLVSGSTYSKIADELGITENTVKFHIKNILSKTGFKNTLQLVSDVVEKRLILPNY